MQSRKGVKFRPGGSGFDHDNVLAESPPTIHTADYMESPQSTFFRRTACLWLVLCAPIPAVSAEPVLNEMGNLQALLENTPIPSAASSDKYRLPTSPETTAFRTALKHILEGDFQSAADEAVLANYEVVSYTDTITSDVFTLLREKNSNQHWGGLYVIDQTPERALVVQCPHPLFDGVRVPAADIFINTQATAYLQSGTHRNNSPVESDCDGDLNDNPYRISDMAHAPESFFQAAHEVIEAHFSRTVSLSFHGMADDSDPADIVVSNGSSHEFVGNSLSRALAARMDEILAVGMDARVAVSHQEPGEAPALAGTTNTQGRATNGSTSPCDTAAFTALFPERFIHMECDPDVRDGNASNWAFVIEALNDLIPEFADPEPNLRTGDLVITEIMTNSIQVGDGTGEYIELFNQTGAPIDMTGWTIGDRGGNSATFSGIIQPGDLFVVGTSADLNGGGVPDGAPDAVWQDAIDPLTLTDGGDTISIIDANGNLVASVTYEDPSTPGVSFELIEGNQHPNGQTARPDYAESVTPFGSDFGSPGTRGGTSFPVVAPAVTAELSGNNPDMTLSFPTKPAVNYTLWRSLDLEGWQLFQGMPPVIGDGEDSLFTFPLTNEPAEFYKVFLNYPAAE